MNKKISKFRLNRETLRALTVDGHELQAVAGGKMTVVCSTVLCAVTNDSRCSGPQNCC